MMKKLLEITDIATLCQYYKFSSAKSTISQNLKNCKNLKIDFAFVSEHCASFGTKTSFFVTFVFVNIPTKSTISHKPKISKIGKLFFYTFQKIAQVFRTKTQSGHFGGQRVVNWDRAKSYILFLAE